MRKSIHRVGLFPISIFNHISQQHSCLDKVRKWHMRDSSKRENRDIFQNKKHTAREQIMQGGTAGIDIKKHPKFRDDWYISSPCCAHISFDIS